MLLIVASLISLVSYKEYGIAWDEPIQRLTGYVNGSYVIQLALTFISPTIWQCCLPKAKKYTTRHYGAKRLLYDYLQISPQEF